MLWKCLNESEIKIPESIAAGTVVFQLAHHWLVHCACVNRRLAGSKLLKSYEEFPSQLVKQIAAKLSEPVGLVGYQMLGEQAQQLVVQLVPKRHYHNSFSPNCFELATLWTRRNSASGESSGATAREDDILVLFQPIQLEEEEKPAMENNKMDEEASTSAATSPTLTCLPNPHILREYAFHLQHKIDDQESHDGMAAMDTESNGKASTSGQSSYIFRLLCSDQLPNYQRTFMQTWLWPQLLKWLRRICSSAAGADEETVLPLDGTIPSIVLLDPDRYAQSYWRIKLELGHPIIKDWHKQPATIKDDVYEQSGIAAYLTELWNAYAIGPQRKFAIVPCGRGILVHLLTKKGLQGFGVDLKWRKCWPQFQRQGTELREVSTIQPNSKVWLEANLSEADFLIGVHAGELDPWIPLMAARLGCNFFLLPSATHDFYGKFSKAKHHSSASASSPSQTTAAAADDNALQQYFAYLEWICARLGFEVAIDRLKISSRRRQCLIGVVPANGLSAASITAAGHQEGLESTIGEILANARFRSNHRWAKTVDNGETEKMEEFSIKSKPSDNKAKYFSSELRDQLVRQVLEHLILADPEAAIGGWHCGGPVSMAQLAREALSEEDRQMLSDQRGGLKTFLRNNAQLFLVHNCQVRIQRWPEVGVEFGRRAAGDTIVRSSQCLFQQLHPQGCPLTSDQCPFKHEE